MHAGSHRALSALLVLYRRKTRYLGKNQGTIYKSPRSERVGADLCGMKCILSTLIYIDKHRSRSWLDMRQRQRQATKARRAEGCNVHVHVGPASTPAAVSAVCRCLSFALCDDAAKQMDISYVYKYYSYYTAAVYAIKSRLANLLSHQSGENISTYTLHRDAAVLSPLGALSQS